MMKYMAYAVIIILVLLLAKIAYKWIQVYQSDDYHQMLSHLYEHTIPTIHADSLKKLHAYTLLDCREDAEYYTSHLPNAQYAGFKNFTIDSFRSIHKDDTIVVYCSVGYRSEKIGEKFISAGYSNVYNLYGGIFEWVNLNNDVIVPEGKDQQIHGFSSSWKKWITRKINIIHD